ncbi:MAG: D-glucuronyl C5-epimerase family protein [Candidatus Eisenbacteria bacterium]
MNGSRRRGVVALLSLALLAIGVVVGTQAYRYCVDYYWQEYLPESRGPGAPGYFYLDWRRDWSDDEELRAATPDGPIRTPRAVEAIPGEWRYDPISVIQTGLSLHDQILDELHDGTRRLSADGRPTEWAGGEAPEFDRFEVLNAQLDWLHAHAEWLPDSVAVWPVPWVAERYGLEPPWYSALSQGQGISLLVRTAQWGRPEDLVLAEAAVRSLLESDLSIVIRDARGVRFLEEFPVESRPEVLNGCLLAWLGLWDYARATGDAQLRTECLELLDRIETQVPKYELTRSGLIGWTRYDLETTLPTSPTYQELHAALARALAEETGRAFWEVRAVEWRRAAASMTQRLRVFGLVAWAKVWG